MKLIYAGMTSAVIAAGLVGSVAAYRSQTVPVSKAVSVQQSKPQAEVQWAPCKEPSKLEDGVCITDVVRTVMRPAPPASVPAAPSYSVPAAQSYAAATTPSYAAGYGTTAPAGVREGDDDAYEDREDHDEGEDREDHAAEDHGDESGSEQSDGEDSEDHADEDHADESESEQSDGEDQEDEH